jgi:hypothetical protein
MTIEFIIQAAHQRGMELLKTFPHEPNYVPHITVDTRTHKASMIVDSLNAKAQRTFPVNVLTSVPKNQAQDVLAMVYRDCVRELRTK